MQLKYQLIEDQFEEITQMRTKTEQAELPDGSWLLRTVIYTPYLITADVSQVVTTGKRKKIKKKKSKKGSKRQTKQTALFDTIDQAQF